VLLTVCGLEVKSIVTGSVADVSEITYKYIKRTPYIVHKWPKSMFTMLSLKSSRAASQVYGVATISRLLKIIGLFAESSLFYRALLQKRPIIYRSLLNVATP